MRQKLMGLIFSAALTSGVALAQDPPQQPERERPKATATTEEEKNIIETAAAAGKFSTFASLIEAAGLTDALKGPGPFTVFAPTDEAFAKLPPEELEALKKDPAKLKKVLSYHVIPGKLMSKDVSGSDAAAGVAKPGRTLEGTALDIKATSEQVKVNNASVVQADIVASNGVIHAIDTVLMPSK